MQVYLEALEVFLSNGRNQLLLVCNSVLLGRICITQ